MTNIQKIADELAMIADSISNTDAVKKAKEEIQKEGSLQLENITNAGEGIIAISPTKFALSFKLILYFPLYLKTSVL